MFVCKFCNKECKSASSVSSHQPVCRSNSNRKNPADWATGNRKGLPSWNAGLHGDKRLMHTVQSKELMSAKRNERSAEWNANNGKAISVAITKKVADGQWHTSLAKRMHIDYNGVDLHGSWEVAYAKFLDNNNIKWQRNKDSFAYTFQGKERRYTPDFYLIDDNVYIEIKGYKTEKDDAKWTQFPPHRKLVVLMKKNLVEMKVI
jgi:hypothetical protein